MRDIDKLRHGAYVSGGSFRLSGGGRGHQACTSGAYMNPAAHAVSCVGMGLVASAHIEFDRAGRSVSEPLRIPGTDTQHSGVLRMDTVCSDIRKSLQRAELEEPGRAGTRDLCTRFAAGGDAAETDAVAKGAGDTEGMEVGAKRRKVGESGQGLVPGWGVHAADDALHR